MTTTCSAICPANGRRCASPADHVGLHDFIGVPHDHTAETCTIETHDHFGQIESCENSGMPIPESDELICGDCGRRMFYDYADEQYHHLTDTETGCFLIPGETS